MILEVIVLDSPKAGIFANRNDELETPSIAD